MSQEESLHHMAGHFMWWLVSMGLLVAVTAHTTGTLHIVAIVLLCLTLGRVALGLVIVVLGFFVFLAVQSWRDRRDRRSA